jgi:hypothetical protein
MRKPKASSIPSPAPQLQIVPAPARQDLTGLTDEQSRELKELIRQINGGNDNNKKPRLPRPPRPRRRSDDELPPAA